MVPQPHPTGKALSGEVNAALLAENCRLREELARAPSPPPLITPRPPASTVRPGVGALGWDGRQSHGAPESNAGG